MYVSTASAPAAIIVQPIASPSSPSVRFTAFDEPTSTSITHSTKGANANHARCGTVLGHPCHSKSGRRLLINGTESRRVEHLELVQNHQRHRHQRPGQPLPEQFGARRQSQVAPLHYLDVVIGKTDRPERERREYRDPYERIGRIGPQHRGQQNRNADQHAAHRRRPRLLQVRLRPVLSHKLPDLELPQLLNHPRADKQRDQQRRKRSKSSAKSQVAEDPERVKKRKQLFVQQPVKQASSKPDEAGFSLILQARGSLPVAHPYPQFLSESVGSRPRLPPIVQPSVSGYPTTALLPGKTNSGAR